MLGRPTERASMLLPRCGERLVLILAKDPVEPSTFWVNPFGVAWPLLRASDLIRVSKDGDVIDGGPVRFLNNAGESSPHRTITKPRPGFALGREGQGLH